MKGPLDLGYCTAVVNTVRLLSISCCLHLNEVYPKIEELLKTLFPRRKHNLPYLKEKHFRERG